MNEKTKEVWRAILITYREMINNRYQHQNLHSQYDLPDAFSEERLENFRNYFLNFLYPHPDIREQLNATFENLDSYIKKPKKLLRLLFDSTGIVLKFGTKLPQIANAGVKALQSFRAATKFENKLTENAILFELEPPFLPDDIDYLISTLNSKEINNFIAGCESLFEILHNRPLVEKIIEVIAFLVEKMKSQPDIYSEDEILGIEMGFNIIKIGNDLFEELNEDDRRRMFEITVQIERDNLNKIFDDGF